jgi:hypothetical protein
MKYIWRKFVEWLYWFFQIVREFHYVKHSNIFSTGERGSVVVKGLGYKPEVAGSRPDEVKIEIYLILPAALGLGVHSASNRNEYGKH